MGMDAERSRRELARRNEQWIADADPLKAELVEIGREAFREKYRPARYSAGAFDARVAQIRMMLDELDREDADQMAGKTLRWTQAGVWFALAAAVISLVAIFV